jgi:hypothetical protein
MELHIDPSGQIRCIYGEEIDLTSLGSSHAQRASHVEPTGDGGWTADLSPVMGPILGPFSFRSEALQAEQAWLTRHWLAPLQ